MFGRMDICNGIDEAVEALVALLLAHTGEVETTVIHDIREDRGEHDVNALQRIFAGHSRAFGKRVGDQLVPDRDEFGKGLTVRLDQLGAHDPGQIKTAHAIDERKVIVTDGVQKLPGVGHRRGVPAYRCDKPVELVHRLLDECR